MKILIITALLQVVALYSSGQTPISNTKWDATIAVPQSIEMRLELIYRVNGRVAELSYFLQNHDSLFIRKLSGVSSCSSGYEACYKIEWLDNGNKFILHNLSDTCTNAPIHGQVYTSIGRSRIEWSCDDLIT